jgi:soluble lytic murein transglycosylase-like protein
MNLGATPYPAVCLMILSSSAHAQAPAREALYALNAIPMLGLTSADFGRFFDEGPRWVRRPDAPEPVQLMSKRRTNGYDALISSYAVKDELDPRLVKAVIAAESEFTPRAKSPAGALGLMQVMPETAGSVGVNGKALLDPEANIRAGTAYLAYLFERAWKRYHLQGVAFSQAPAWLLQRVVAAYNAGPRFLGRRHLYRATREYVKRVLTFYKSALTELRA